MHWHHRGGLVMSVRSRTRQPLANETAPVAPGHLCTGPAFIHEHQMIGGRTVAGSVQLLFSVTGFVMVMAWFARLMYFYYGLVSSFTGDSSNETFKGHWMGLLGLILFATAWSWSLFTSFRLIASTRPGPPGPPPLNDRA